MLYERSEGQPKIPNLCSSRFPLHFRPGEGQVRTIRHPLRSLTFYGFGVRSLDFGTSGELERLQTLHKARLNVISGKDSFGIVRSECPDIGSFTVISRELVYAHRGRRFPEQIFDATPILRVLTKYEGCVSDVQYTKFGVIVMES